MSYQLNLDPSLSCAELGTAQPQLVFLFSELCNDVLFDWDHLKGFKLCNLLPSMGLFFDSSTIGGKHSN